MHCTIWQLCESTKYIHCRHKVDTHASKDRHRRNSEHFKSNTAISFDHQKGYYSLGSSGLNLDYWFKTSDEMVSEDYPNSDDYSYKEEVMEDDGMDNWCSDDEEVLQIYPETAVVPSLHIENREYQQDDVHHSVDHNHHGLLDMTTKDDIRVTCDSTDHQLVYIKGHSSENIIAVYLADDY